MLYLYNPQPFVDAQGNMVTVFPDSTEHNVFYPIPAMPRIRRDKDGKPVIRLIKYRGSAQTGTPQVAVPADGKNDDVPANGVPTIDGEVAGGFLIFDTEFTLDQESMDKIAMELDEQVRARYLAAGREVPDGFKIILRQPQWSDGTVEILMEDNAAGLYESVSKSGKPSLMGNNVSSVAAALRPWQATLIENSFTNGGFNPIQVNYNLKYLAKIPPVRINIYASAYDSYQMYKTYADHPNKGLCSNRDKIVSEIATHVVSRDVVRISIDSGGLTINDETFKQLNAMAMGMVQQWIQQQFLKPPPERATKEQIQEFTLQSLSETDFRDLNIMIEQSATVEVEIHPQGTLDGIFTGGLNPQEFITEVDLDADDFYQDRKINVKVYADFPAADTEPEPADLLFVEVMLKYGDHSETHTWDADGSGTATANGGRWNVSWHKVPDLTTVEWTARLRFRDPNHEMVLTGKTDSTELNIPVASPGRARLEIRQNGVPWDIVQHVIVKVEHTDSAADPQHLVREYLYTQDTGMIQMNEPIWTERKAPYTVKLMFKLKNTNEIEQAAQVEADTYVIETPFKEILTIPIRARWTNEEWKEDIVNIEYRDEGNGYVRSGELYLSEEGDDRQVWTIPLLDPDCRSYRIKWARRDTSGGTFTSADFTGARPDGWIECQGSDVIYTGHPEIETGDMIRVIVDPLIFFIGDLEDGKKVMRALIHLQRDGSNDVDDHSFTINENKAWIWKDFVSDPNNKKYKYWGEYFTMPFSRIAFGPIESTEETVVLVPA